MKDQLFHNPRCSKSREALGMVNESSKDVPVRLYLEDPPSLTELRELVKMLGVRPIELCRRSEAIFKELDLNAEMKDDAVLRAMHEHPILIERPILVVNGRAVVGRPTEKLLDLL